MLTLAVARGYSKLLAYKDEYEVARLFSDGQFQRELQQQFEGDVTLTFHMAPPLLGKRKRAFGPWMGRLLALLARARGCAARGSTCLATAPNGAASAS